MTRIWISALVGLISVGCGGGRETAREEKADAAFYGIVEKLHEGRQGEAEQDLLALVGSHPDFPDAYRELYQFGVEEGRIEETLGLFDEFSRRDAKNGLPLAYKAITMSVAGKEAEAAELFKKSILADPDNMNLAEPVMPWMPFGLPVEALQDWFRTARRERGDRPLLVIGEVECLLMLQQFDDAARQWEVTSHRIPSHYYKSQIGSSLAIGDFLKESAGSSERLARAFQEAFEMARKTGSPQAIANAASDLAWSHDYQGDLKGAVRSHEEALALAERADFRELICHAHKNLGRLFTTMGDLPSARKQLAGCGKSRVTKKEVGLQRTLRG